MLRQFATRFSQSIQRQSTQSQSTPPHTVSEDEAARLQSREQLYCLLCFVQDEITRTEQLFDFAEEDSLIDNMAYTLKSLQAQQQYLVQNIRRLDGIGVEAPASHAEEKDMTAHTGAVAKEGYVMG